MTQSKYHKWTKEEEMMLSLLTDKYGLNWELIRRRGLPHMSAISIKNKYYSSRNSNERSYTRYQKKQHEVRPKQIQEQPNIDYIVNQLNRMLLEMDNK